MALIQGKQIEPGTITSTQVDGSTVALLATTQTFTGLKNFSVSPTFPDSPSGPTAGVNKNYVDSVAAGITWKHPSRAATATALSAYTYNNGTSGLGATLTSTDVGFAPLGSIDGVAVTIGDRILVKNEVGGNAKYNGIYTFTTDGDNTAVNWKLTRATDYDQNPNLAGENEVVSGSATFIEEGSTYINAAFVETTANPIVIGTDPISFVQFAGSGSFSFRNGLVLTGNIVDVAPGDASLVSTPGSLIVQRDGAGAVGLTGSGIAVNTDGTSIEINTNALRIAAGAAGGGLGYSAGVLNVNTDRGLTVA